MRVLSSLLPILPAVMLLACSGSSNPSALKGVRCVGSAEGSNFCLASCNLGCSTVGCAITEIPQNQPLVFDFTQDVDPSTVNSSTISLKTATGESPVGEFRVEKNRISFVPSVIVQGGLTVFGFRANQTYILTLPGGPNETMTVRSTSGQKLSNTFSCSLTVSKGIVDLDNAPPTAVLLQPTATTNVSRETLILLEFSEYIDIGPFQGGSTQTSPIQYRLRRTRVVGGRLECDTSKPAELLEGTPRAELDTANARTRISLKPAIKLPGEVCVEVEVTEQVKDLSGRAARRQLFQFTTQPSSAVEQSLVEGFASDLQMEKDASSGTWSGGRALPGLVGGDGKLGDFNPTHGVSLGGNVYQWSTDNQSIPGDTTLSGRTETVTDGVFNFRNLKLASGITVVFVGSKKPILRVRGNCEIQGKFVVSGADLQVHNGKTSATGQLGGAGGPGGGRGGAGADRGDGVANRPNFNGQNGEDVQLPAGHAYAGRQVGTGGKGSLQFPTSGLNSAVTYNAFSGSFSGQISAGGGGGGFRTPGGIGRATNTAGNVATDLGPASQGGIQFDILPLPGGAKSLDHFLVGGSGGAGGGSHPYFSPRGGVPGWVSGAAGSGGGGVLALRVGRNLQMSQGSAIEARGGRGTAANNVTFGPAAPGGGGSGGSVLLQVGGQPSMGGLLDVRGADPSTVDLGVSYLAKCEGGLGAPGYLRLEVPSDPSVGLVGAAQPPATADNVGLLADTDPVVGAQSKWYTTREVFPPVWLRYEIEAEVNGVPKLFSDDAARGPLAEYGSSSEVWFLVQGAKVGADGQPGSGTIGPWHPRVAGPDSLMQDDRYTGYRFLLFFNRASVQNIVVKKITVYYRS